MPTTLASDNSIRSTKRQLAVNNNKPAMQSLLGDLPTTNPHQWPCATAGCTLHLKQDAQDQAQPTSHLPLLSCHPTAVGCTTAAISELRTANRSRSHASSANAHWSCVGGAWEK
uniref:Uncharacterized protein n=1 Tax=Eutreptiella gymnastica TaxID=73025 RepID=A0A7S4CK67_9EUGL